MLCLCSAVANVDARDQPNIILILADDIGIEGLRCYGGLTYQTPHLDRMAAEGVRFTHAYSQPLCTPSRVELMTGQYNHRNWRCFGILDPDAGTIGHRLRASGYATAIFGKWQLQSYDPPHFPGGDARRGTGMHVGDAGFDQWAVFHGRHTEDKGSRYANPIMLEGSKSQPEQLRRYPGRYGEDIWVEKIIDFLNKTRDQPSFVYYPMALPHNPFVPTPRSPEYDPTSNPTEDVRFAKDMIEYMDVVVGRLLSELQERQLAKDTIVVFTGDNGTNVKVASEFTGDRTIIGGKASPLQTGIHVPLIVWNPAKIEPRVTNRLVDFTDILPTLLEWAGSDTKNEPQLEGVSFAG
ncbi:MAG: sulfatase-like hydrolase/transferase, partial [Planctomycetota bacterium]